MFEGEITFDQLQNALAEYAEAQKKKQSRWTDELDSLLLAGRDEHGMTWDTLVAWWKEQFGWGSDKSLNARYKQLKARGDD